MTVDYDGVIVGGTLQGREAAALAVREGARVALVEPRGAVDSALNRRLMVQVLAQAGQRIYTERLLGYDSQPNQSLHWGHLKAKVAMMAAIAYPHLSLENLAASGVDIVEGPGQFSPKPRLAFSTAERHLSARGFVLCPSTQVTIPAIPGLAATPYRTVESLGELTTQPEALVILGRSPAAIALAQSLALMGTRVALVSRGNRLLPTEDADISIFVESLLQAAGVDLYLGRRPEQVDYDQEFTIRFSGGEVLRVPCLLLATAQQPKVAGLNLQTLGLGKQVNYLPVDEHLNTTHPRVFVCGPALGGYWAEVTDHQDVPIALRNALYLPGRKLVFLNRLAVLATVPALTRLGMTATQAQQGYGPEARVVQVPLGEAIAAHWEGNITGFCRWVVHRDGRLLGAQICGPHAEDLIQTVAVMIQQNLRIQHLDRLPWLPQSNGEILHRLVDVWQHDRWQPGRWRRDWAENWFNWRRSRPFR